MCSVLLVLWGMNLVVPTPVRARVSRWGCGEMRCLAVKLVAARGDMLDVVVLSSLNICCVTVNYEMIGLLPARPQALHVVLELSRRMTFVVRLLAKARCLNRLLIIVGRMFRVVSWVTACMKPRFLLTIYDACMRQRCGYAVIRVLLVVPAVVQMLSGSNGLLLLRLVVALLNMQLDDMRISARWRWWVILISAVIVVMPIP